MQLHSNIPAIVNRLKRLQSGIPEAAQRAIAPEYWGPRLQHIATKTLRAQWALERNVQTRALYERLTPRILETLTAQMRGAVSEFTLSTPRTLTQQLGIAAAIDYNLGQQTPTGRRKKFAIEEPDAQKNLQAVRDSIRQWVDIEKHLDERDAGLTSDQIVDRIERIMGLSPDAAPGGRSQAMEEAGRRLASAIELWLAGEGDNPAVNQTPATVTISPALLGQWLTAVLLAWREFVRVHLRDKIQLELLKLHQRVRSELL